MKQVSTLFDALNNENFAFVVKDGVSTKYYGAAGQGSEWAEWANSMDTKSLDSAHLPAGVIQGPFRPIDDQSFKSLIVSIGSDDLSFEQKFSFSSIGYRYGGSYKSINSSVVPAVMDTPINYFTKTQYISALNYKGLTFKSNIKRSSLMLEARANNYAFNFENNMYNCKPAVSEIKSLRQRIDTNVGRSSERRMGMHIKNAILSDGTRKRFGIAYSEIETKSVLEDGINTKTIGDKTIGERIGGGTRAARRLSRAAFSRFDPKAWDGDGDGIVQEGTPYERPAIPGVNGRDTGGVVDVAAATRAWEKLNNGGGLSSRSGRKLEGVKKIERRSTQSPTRVPNGGSIEPPAGEPRKSKPTRKLENVKPIEPRSSGGKNGLSKRISDATAERQASGLASRSGKRKTSKSKISVAGVDRVDENDGNIWESLNDEQRTIVEKNARMRRAYLERYFKQINDGTWWDSFINDPKNEKFKDPDGKTYNKDSRIWGEALTSLSVAVEDYKKREFDRADRETDPKKKERILKDASRILKMFDDLETLNRMDEDDDFSLLEHLHEISRDRILVGTDAGNSVKPAYGVAKDELNIYDTVFTSDSGKKLARQIAKRPSSFFEPGGGKKEKPKGKTDRKLNELARRILTPNPERAERRRLRKLGKSGKATETAAEASDQASPTRRRIRRAKNQFLLKIKGKRNPQQIQQKVDKKIADNPHAFKNPDGTIEITDDSVSRLAQMADGFKVRKRAGKAGQAVVTNANARKSLVALWNGNNYNATPTWVREDEIPGLLEAGYIPIKRGVRGEQFADIWLNSPNRFVPGQGAAVVGAGEYWSHESPGSTTQWDSYISGKDGVIAFVKADRIATSRQAEQFKSDHSKIHSVVDRYISGEGSGGRWDEELTARELAEEIERNLADMLPDDDPVWQTEWGQVYKGLFKWMKSVDDKDTKRTKQAVGALKFVHRMKDAESTVHAGFLGYDGIDFGKNDGRVVMHNRSAMMAINEPMTLDSIKTVMRTARGES